MAWKIVTHATRVASRQHLAREHAMRRSWMSTEATTLCGRRMARVIYTPVPEDGQPIPSLTMWGAPCRLCWTEHRRTVLVLGGGT